MYLVFLSYLSLSHTHTLTDITHISKLFCYTRIKFHIYIHITVKYAISFVQSICDAEEATKKLTEDAFSRVSNDNTTCMVVRLHDKGTTILGIE